MPHDVTCHKHFIPHIIEVAKQVLKIFINVYKIPTPILVDVRLAQYTNVMAWPKAPKVQINEQPIVVHHQLMLFM